MSFTSDYAVSNLVSGHTIMKVWCFIVKTKHSCSNLLFLFNQIHNNEKMSTDISLLHDENTFYIV